MYSAPEARRVSYLKAVSFFKNHLDLENKKAYEKTFDGHNVVYSISFYNDFSLNF